MNRSTRHKSALSALFVPLVAVCVFGASAGSARAQDMAEMMKWASTPVYTYVAIGEYNTPRTTIMGGGGEYGALAPVSDKVKFTFDWDQTTLQFVGEPKIENFPSTVGPVINDVKGCPAPRPSGDFEYRTVLDMKATYGGFVELTVRTDFVGGEAPKACGGGWVTVEPKSVTEAASWAVTPPTVMAMPLPENMSKSADGKTLTVKDEDWSWTITLTPKK